MKENMLTGGVSPDVANPLLDAEITIPKHVELLVEDIFNLPHHIMPSHMLVLKERILSAYASGISGVVITRYRYIRRNCFFLIQRLATNYQLF